MLTPLVLSPSFGFGDRLGLATPGHISAVRGTKFAPIFAQQSVRENARTGRTPQQVMDDARRAVDAAMWDAPWGADADHLKTLDDLPAFVEAGYTFFTVDPGEYVDNRADTDPLEALKEKVAGVNWDRLSALYLNQSDDQVWGRFDTESLLRAIVKYGKAIEHAAVMFNCLSQMKDTFDFEVSVDETDSPTTPLEHFFIANELTRAGVKFTSLAPRFIGRFEKGVDYIGDLNKLDAELARHWGDRIHVKTAGTSYLEALRVLAKHEPDLFLQIYSLGWERYELDKKTYHVSAQVDQLPETNDLPSLLDDFHAREILHVTFGSALAGFGEEIKKSLQKHAEAYYTGLQTHFGKHLDLLSSR